MSSSGTIINMVSNSNTNNLYKVHHYHHHHKSIASNGKMNGNSGSSSTSSQQSQEGSASSPGIYLDDTDVNSKNTVTMDIQMITECSISDNTVDNSHRKYNHNSSLFGNDYIKNFVILSKLYSPQEYYANIHGQISQSLPFINGKKQKYRGSDAPSDISYPSDIKSHKKSRFSRLMLWIKYTHSSLWNICKFMFDLIILWCNRFRQWQKELHEAPIEVKEKYFFVVSTLISTVLFYILFLCLDIMIKHWFALPSFITQYSFSISYCISYLTSVIWQHFFNQYFVFTMALINTNNNDAFCDSLFRTYLVYGLSLMLTAIIGSALQIYARIADEFVLFLTLPISGVINYYLLRYCHNKHTKQHQYQLIHHKYKRKKQRERASSSQSHIYHNTKHHNNKHNHAVDDIVIV